MNNTQLRGSLLAQADQAFLALADQVDDLLDAAKTYCDLYPATTKSDLIKTEQLDIAVANLAHLIRQLAMELARWKQDDRMFSRMGVEVDYLNELRVTMEATMMFFDREGVEHPRATFSLVEKSHAEYLRCNRLL